MSDERKRNPEWSRLLDAWPAVTPPPGFADRVLAACDLPPPVQLAIVREPPPRRFATSSILVCIAIAAAVVLIPFALHRRQLPVSSATAVTLGNSADLGPLRD